MYKKALENIKNFYNIDFKNPEERTKIFELLKIVLPVESCAIFYLSPNELKTELANSKNYKSKYKINDNLTKKLYDINNSEISNEIARLTEQKGFFAASKLCVKGVVLGVICASTTKELNKDEKVIFHSYADIIAEILKDIEISKILNSQMQTMEKWLNESSCAYDDIKKQNKKIKQNEKFQNEFIANISHDLRTPLNSIICLSEALSNNIFGQLNPKQSEYVEDIRISGIRLLGIINEVLDIAKLESKTIKLNLTQIDTITMINEVCNILKPLSQKKKLKINTELSPITIRGDYIKLQQVLFNIIGNAIKFSHENSTIELRSEQTGSHIEISIKDNGIGITKTNLKNIFKKFYQVESSMSKTETSTGLGLTIAKEFVKLHKGKIEVDSELGKWTEFRIKLPVTND